METFTEIISPPEFHSDVPGFDLMADTGIQTETEPDHQIAHNEYVAATIVSDGTNSRYDGVLNPFVVLFFVHPDSPFMLGKHEGSVYASMYTDIPVDRLILVEGFDTPGLIGVNLQIWSDQSDEPILEVCVAPMKVNLN